MCVCETKGLNAADRILAQLLTNRSVLSHQTMAEELKHCNCHRCSCYSSVGYFLFGYETEKEFHFLGKIAFATEAQGKNKLAALYQ